WLRCPAPHTRAGGWLHRRIGPSAAFRRAVGTLLRVHALIIHSRITQHEHLVAPWIRQGATRCSSSRGVVRGASRLGATASTTRRAADACRRTAGRLRGGLYGVKRLLYQEALFW